MTSREIADLYADLELRLIQSLRRNLAAHKSQEQAEGGQNGVPKQWPAWQAEKLRSLNKFRRQNEKIADEFSTRIDAETRAMLEGQFAEADGSENAFFGVNADKVGALIDEMTAIEENVQKAALRYMDDVYRRTILRADAALTAGGVTMQQAVDLAVKDFLRQGITCIRYKNGRLVNIATYAEMALRTSNTRAMLLGEAQKRERMGVDTVLVSQYGACSDTCLPWQGLVYIDDVWQPYHGDSNATRGGSYGYSRNGRSYPLLSVAVKAGLFHPNCRHTLGTWIEGVSRRPKPMDKAKIEADSKLEAKQRRMELAVRRDKRLVAGTQGAAQVKEYKARLRRDQKALREFIAEHDDVLRRDRWRERMDVPLQVQPQNAILKGNRNRYLPITEQSIERVKSFSCRTLTATGQRSLENAHKRLLVEAATHPAGTEVARCYGLDMQPIGGAIVGSRKGGVKIPRQQVPYIAVHNHPSGLTFSPGDIRGFANSKNMRILTAVGNDGTVYALERDAQSDEQALAKLRLALERKISSAQTNAETMQAVNDFLQEVQQYGYFYYTTGN